MLALAAPGTMLAVTPSAAHAAADMSNWWVYVTNDRADDLKKLLAQGADPNTRHQTGQPAIMRAVAEGAWGVFDVLAADPRTDLNIENPAGETPLMYLAIAGDTARAEALIARGAQVNRLGWTPLAYAASKGNVDTARMLLRHKAMVNAPSGEGRTPLMMAALSGNRDMVQLLLDAGADPTTTDQQGRSAADWALAGKSESLSEELKRIADKTWKERDAQRGAGASLPSAPAAPTAPSAPSLPAAPMPGVASPAPAAPPAPAASGSGSGVQGVQGVNLNRYD
ncbi:ankyrin repeat domain-containing protein [Pseudomonadota bacterium AL_CKDN230030165-1A_HGKHYDSX7]